jgi:hypothetical protein
LAKSGVYRSLQREIKERNPVTEKELRKLNRYQLLELLMIQTKRVEELETQLEEIQSQRNQQQVQLSRLGSMAEVAMQVSGVLEAAQSAAELYLQAARSQAERMEQEAAEKVAAMLAAAEETEKQEKTYEES